ncbi:hypothetical protein [Herbaspirillum sp. ST 5-3]|uniref:energy transducer TonB n=1 Tax=Oxalobacteraceae TaxID=75682 RepID=UPI0010A3FB49|nr:hypothetical protein [Herbaspirillum sp. ST 5-3]
MNFRNAFLLAAGVLAGCATSTGDRSADRPTEKATRAERRAEPRAEASSASSVDAYKRDLALRISDVNSGKVYPGRPQALLRSVVVLRYAVDAHGNLVRSEIMRSNHDRETESIALASLRNAAPFPRPASHLVRHGKLEISETWLFNNDGRFQLRTIAQPQMDK